MGFSILSFLRRKQTIGKQQSELETQMKQESELLVEKRDSQTKKDKIRTQVKQVILACEKIAQSRIGTTYQTVLEDKLQNLTYVLGKARDLKKQGFTDDEIIKDFHSPQTTLFWEDMPLDVLKHLATMDYRNGLRSTEFESLYDESFLLKLGLIK